MSSLVFLGFVSFCFVLLCLVSYTQALVTGHGTRNTERKGMFVLLPKFRK